MKFEKLEKSKFETFKTSELQDAFKIIGGTPQATTYKNASGASGADTIDYETQTGASTSDTNGSVDYSRNH